MRHGDAQYLAYHLGLGGYGTISHITDTGKHHSRAILIHLDDDSRCIRSYAEYTVAVGCNSHAHADSVPAVRGILLFPDSLLVS